MWCAIYNIGPAGEILGYLRWWARGGTCTYLPYSSYIRPTYLMYFWGTLGLCRSTWIYVYLHFQDLQYLKLAAWIRVCHDAYVD